MFCNAVLSAISGFAIIWLRKRELVAPIVCGGFMFGPCFVMQYLVSSLALQSSG